MNEDYLLLNPNKQRIIAFYSDHTEAKQQAIEISKTNETGCTFIFIIQSMTKYTNRSGEESQHCIVEKYDKLGFINSTKRDIKTLKEVNI